jgi:hypothetical protein
MYSAYLSAVRGRREFRAAYRRLRVALDRIARFEECFVEAADRVGSTPAAGEALAAVMARYARSVLDGGEA